ncbi:MAG: hypothetical protein WD942_09070 [Dehalococcoidia bacterium]
MANKQSPYAVTSGAMQPMSDTAVSAAPERLLAVVAAQIGGTREFLLEEEGHGTAALTHLRGSIDTCLRLADQGGSGELQRTLADAAAHCAAVVLALQFVDVLSQRLEHVERVIADVLGTGGGDCIAVDWATIEHNLLASYSTFEERAIHARVLGKDCDCFVAEGDSVELF